MGRRSARDAGAVDGRDESRSAELRIAYVVSHHPRVSHTFIDGEIAALEDAGVIVVPIALNAPAEVDLQTDHDRAERARTFYVKAQRKRVLAGTIIGAMMRHPVAVFQGMRLSFTAGGLNVAVGIKTAAQFLEGIVVWRHCRRSGVRALHAHFGQAPASVAAAAAWFGNAVDRRERWTWSVTIHGWHEFVTEDTSRLRDKIGAADSVVAISDYTRAQLMRIANPIDWPKLVVVRCGIDIEEFDRRPARDVADPPVVVMTARLSPEKGHLVLVEALALLRRDGLDVRAKIIGNGPFHGDIVSAAEGAGVGDLVDMVGAIPPKAVAAALRSADVFCLPSFAEGLPVSIMEAMAIGVPVVTTAISGIPELVVVGETGWVVPAGNAERFAEAIRAALTASGRDSVIDEAARRVRDRHDRQRNVGELLLVLRSVHGSADR